MSSAPTSPPAVRPTSPPAVPVDPRPRPRRPRRTPLPYVLVVPSVLALALALGYPLVRQVVLSFQDFGLAQQFGQPPEWLGLENYRTLLTDPYLWRVTLRSIAFCLVNAALTMLIGVGLALAMRHMSRSVRLLLQTGLLLAWAMPVVAALTVWQWLFDTQYGVVNYLLTQLGADYTGHSWLLRPLSFFFVATVIVVWMSVPFVAFTVYAALTQLPAELLEAAEIDGAGPVGRLRHVMLPTILPVLLVVGLLQVIWDLRVFTQIYVLQKAGGSAQDTNLLGTYIYRLGIGGGEFGMSAAVAIFMLVLTVLLTAPYVRAMLRQEG
ncbi:sugar ABC transporter permease [Nocardioides sp. zg-1308]|uniref:Sugar ABC transporter permease n=1 Tax=Nocardioides renjunii TaxID=3095075 RepID=A0ABU5K751_9ACTN|nr:MULTISPECIES: sugar ABC transporter permease [unclassified Nocardioides]MDZ5660294.1 sugar ABC transporter permease [Nocardioides sp. S-58]NPD03405.1 sugar ABC transporter permease [Nocardioides sp. zg-1308]WQQ21303.1 sugar ABC transporter permease [Nocardioides sp. S-34]